MPIAEALTSITAMITLVKTLKDIDHDLDKGQLKSQMAQLYSDLADVKMDLVDAQQDLHSKDQTIKELNERFEFESALVEIGGFKYDVEDGNPIGLPYCPTCEVKEGKFYRLSRHDDEISMCFNCKNVHNAAQNGRVHLDQPEITVSPDTPFY